jgi:hypothetical protein
MRDDTLANEALGLADGAHIHSIKALVALYRNLKEPAEVIQEIERELRCFIAQKRLADIPQRRLKRPHQL